MKSGIVALAVAAMVGGIGYGVVTKKISLPAVPGILASLRSVKLPNKEIKSSAPVSSSSAQVAQGQVKGMSIEEKVAPTFAKVQELAAIASKIGSVVGVQAVQTGQEVVQNATSTPGPQAAAIDLGKAVAQITSSVEQIPSNIAQQAKVEYCKQVLLQATASATPR